jgi:hypothetical protein
MTSHDTPASPEYPYQAPASPPAATSGSGQMLAIVGIIFAVLGLLGVISPLHLLLDLAGIVLAIVGVVCGHIALGRSASGKQGLAIAVLVIGYVAIAIGIVHFFSLIAFAHLFRRLHFRAG